MEDSNYYTDQRIRDHIVNDKHMKGIPGIVSPVQDQRMAYWKNLKYGMIIHWGLYSQIGGVWNGEPVKDGYSEQIQMWANIPESEYVNVAKSFTGEYFDPDEICLLAKEAGMNYIIMTSKHHDGFCMFDTDTTDYNVVKQTLYGKDPLKLLSEACRRHGLEFGVYFSLVDWHQGHLFDVDNNNLIPSSIEGVIKKQLKELMTNYGPICEIWFDMSSPTPDQSQEFIRIVREYQPEAVINSRVWNNMGDFRTLGDNEVPSVNIEGAWQTPASVYQETWGYRKWQTRDYLDEKVKELLKGFVGGGNYLLNIGPRGDGSVVEFEAEVLRQVGQWIRRHPFILEASETQFDQHPWGQIKIHNNKLYLIVTRRPENRILLHGLLANVSDVVEEGTTNGMIWHQEGDTLSIMLPSVLTEPVLPVIEVQLNQCIEVFPKKTVILEEGQQQLTTNDLYQGYGYRDQGNYNSMHQTVVRDTAYLLGIQRGNVFVELFGNAALDKTYCIQWGETFYTIKGKELNSFQIGPLKIKENVVTPFTVRLAKSSFAGEPLDFSFELANLYFKKDNY
ncbi:alpha-L-fucosidase [Tuberibacillus sp. Marseille-P3662]|uniref:alpha-L-fucosidase n=1 Tax=Tuberibacillus sp. Marseille-P3662 TaxID=1965358 RepID=UPI0015945E50|nr:alpha-L-fucosidase [Tuberibacillus sp. Marseille-P3662]